MYWHGDRPSAKRMSKLEVSKSCVFDTSEIETEIGHINNDARSANKRSNSHLLECPRPWRFPWWRGDDGVGGVGVPGGRGQVRHGPAAVHQLLRHGAGGGVMLLFKLTHDCLLSNLKLQLWSVCRRVSWRARAVRLWLAHPEGKTPHPFSLNLIHIYCIFCLKLLHFYFLYEVLLFMKHQDCH